MLHAALKEALDTQCAAALLEPVTLCRDALVARLRNGVALELRFASADEYSVGWRWGDAQLRIDTAPLHRELVTWPNHLHDSDGRLHADPLTRAGDAPLTNARRVIAALLQDPLLTAHVRPG